jgi:hypothetical protein
MLTETLPAMRHVIPAVTPHVAFLYICSFVLSLDSFDNHLMLKVCASTAPQLETNIKTILVLTSQVT